MSQREIGRSIGDRVGSRDQVSDSILVPRFGWRELHDPHSNPELRVVKKLDEYGLKVLWTGSRVNSYDLEVRSNRPGFSDPYASLHGVSLGKYEVKSLWRRTSNRAFDRRFKAGRRGEEIYGRHDSIVKSFALALERCIDDIIDDSVDDPRGERRAHEMLEFVEQSHDLIEAAIGRRHSRAFADRIRRIAQASLSIPTLSAHARSVLGSTVHGVDIVRGFSDCEGIFLVAGPRYTLVTRDEIPTFIALDSASSEGLKLRYTQKIPFEKESKKETDGI